MVFPKMETRSKIAAMEAHNNHSTAHKTGVRSAYTWTQVHEDVKKLYDAKNSYRRIAKEDYLSKITHSTIQRIVAGIEPKSPVIRDALGLPAYKSVLPIDGEIPEGSQALRAIQCECGQWFIQNHPRRVRCFVCAPYKGKKP